MRPLEGEQSEALIEVLLVVTAKRRQLVRAPETREVPWYVGLTKAIILSQRSRNDPMPVSTKPAMFVWSTQKRSTHSVLVANAHGASRGGSKPT